MTVCQFRNHDYNTPGLNVFVNTAELKLCEFSPYKLISQEMFNHYLLCAQNAIFLF